MYIIHSGSLRANQMFHCNAVVILSVGRVLTPRITDRLCLPFRYIWKKPTSVCIGFHNTLLGPPHLVYLSVQHYDEGELAQSVSVRT